MKVIYQDKEWEVEGPKTVRQVVEELDLVPDTALAIRDGELLTERAVLEPDDVVKLVVVVAGG